MLIAGAGSETVTKLIGNGAALFEQCPEQWELVLNDAGAIPGAVEEILRFNPPSQYQGRFTTEDVHFESGTIPAGSPTLLLTGAATRDPRAFERADEFDISRDAQPPSVSGMASIRAWGRGWPDSKAGSPSRKFAIVGRISKSTWTRPSESTWQMSPATRIYRSMLNEVLSTSSAR